MFLCFYSQVNVFNIYSRKQVRDFAVVENNWRPKNSNNAIQSSVFTRHSE